MAIQNKCYWGKVGFFLAITGAVSACGSSPKKSESPASRDEAKASEDDEMGEGYEHRARAPQIDGEEDGEGVEIEGLKGHLDPYDIQRGIEPRSAALADCFQSQAKSDKYLGGSVELAFLVARDGKVKSVHASRSDLGSWAVESCLLSEGMKMKFPKPKGGEAEFSLPLEFEGTKGSHWWNEEQAEGEVAKKRAELDGCSALVGGKIPKNIWVTLYLGNRGVVRSVGFASPKTVLTEQWAQCAHEKVSGWTLSDPRGKVAKLGFRYNPE